MSFNVKASFFGSSLSAANGRPWPTSQNGQRRVQISPKIIKVAVPWLKHSERLGHEASSQTECKPCFLKEALI